MRELERRLNALWYSTKPVPWLMRFLARIYSWALQRRAPLLNEQLGVPVLVVGNFTVGGTGKTPLIIAIVSHLQQRGLRVGVVSRGYGRKSRVPHSVDINSPVADVGDEPLLIVKRTGVALRVDADRLAAANYLIAAGCQIIVSDDGLQHRRLPRQIELEVLDAERMYGNGQLLPAGPLRELPRQVNLRVINGAIEDTDAAYAMRLYLSHAVNLGTGERRALSRFATEPFCALAGIGNPERFFKALNALGLTFKTVAFADHYPFQEKDIPAGTVLMTEKDATKCQRYATNDLWSIPADAQLSPAFYSALDAQLCAHGVTYA